MLMNSKPTSKELYLHKLSKIDSQFQIPSPHIIIISIKAIKVLQLIQESYDWAALFINTLLTRSYPPTA